MILRIVDVDFIAVIATVSIKNSKHKTDSFMLLGSPPAKLDSMTTIILT